MSGETQLGENIGEGRGTSDRRLKEVIFKVLGESMTQNAYLIDLLLLAHRKLNHIPWGRRDAEFDLEDPEKEVTPIGTVKMGDQVGKISCCPVGNVSRAHGGAQGKRSR